MTKNAKCANCGNIEIIADDWPKFCCSACHILNTPQPSTAGTGDQACGCLLPTDPVWQLPVGVKCSPRGKKFDLYLTADDAAPMSREKWVEIFGYDPMGVLHDMRELGEKGVPGYINLSTLGKRKVLR